MIDPHITEIEERAKARNVRLDDVLRTAGVAKTTWYRWHHKNIGPTLKTIRRLQSALEQLERAA